MFDRIIVPARTESYGELRSVVVEEPRVTEDLEWRILRARSFRLSALGHLSLLQGQTISGLLRFLTVLPDGTALGGAGHIFVLKRDMSKIEPWQQPYYFNDLVLGAVLAGTLSPANAAMKMFSEVFSDTTR